MMSEGCIFCFSEEINMFRKQCFLKIEQPVMTEYICIWDIIVCIISANEWMTGVSLCIFIFLSFKYLLI